MDKLCKNCRFGSFPSNGVPGSRAWKGICMADILAKEGKKHDRLKYHDIMQHFHCSNNKYEPMTNGTEARVGQPEDEGQA